MQPSFGQYCRARLAHLAFASVLGDQVIALVGTKVGRFFDTTKAIFRTSSSPVDKVSAASIIGLALDLLVEYEKD